MDRVFAWFGTLAGRALMVLIAVLALWWVSDSILDAIRAPMKRERDAAVEANASLLKDNERLVVQNARFDQLLMRRSAFERDVKQRLNGIEQNFAALKAANPEVKKWAETPIPPEVLQ